MKHHEPIPKQLEQILSQGILEIYQTQLGHQPSYISCQLLDKILTIVVENPITQPERLLMEAGNRELAEQVRSNLHQAVRPKLKALIEEVLQVSVTELMSNSTSESSRASFVALLTTMPEVNKLC
jgi:uncharacterized protein YbcI